MTTRHCSKMVFTGLRHDWGGHGCTRKASIERDGKWWCRLHDPEVMAKKSRERELAYENKQKTDREVQLEAGRLAAALGIDGEADYSSMHGCYVRRLVISFEDAQKLLERMR
jgi:hypothetical protein